MPAAKSDSASLVIPSKLVFPGAMSVKIQNNSPVRKQTETPSGVISGRRSACPLPGASDSASYRCPQAWTFAEIVRVFVPAAAGDVVTFPAVPKTAILLFITQEISSAMPRASRVM